MQIFEITQRQPVNEINYGATTAARVPAAVSRGAAIGRGFAGALGTALTNAPLKALGARTGSDLVPDPDRVGLFGKSRAAISDRMDQAVQAAMPAITQQADQQWRMWDASIKDLTRKAGGNMAQVDPAQLKNALMTQITTIGRAYGIPNYKSLPNEVNPEEFGGAAREEAMDTVASIDAAIADILDPQQQSGTDAKNNWLNLTKELYAAGLQSKFRERIYSYSDYTQPTTSKQTVSPAVQNLINNPQDMAQINRRAQQMGIPPNTLNQLLGLTPQMNVQQQQTATAESVKKRLK